MFTARPLAHGETKRLFCIHSGEYIVLENIYILLYTQSLPPTFKNRVFGLDFLSIGAKGDTVIFDGS